MRLDFLIKYSIDVDEDTDIVMFDIFTFYTSIPHEVGFEAIGYLLTKCHEDFHPNFEKEFVLESENFILENNTLTYDSKFYLQINGDGNGCNSCTKVCKCN